MPTYEYRCAKCGRHFDVYQAFSEEPLTKHAECGGKVTKVLSPAGIVLKGSGFYKTDNRSGRSSKEAAKETSKERSTEKKDNKEAARASDSSSKSPDTSSSSSGSGSSSGSKGEAKSA